MSIFNIYPLKKGKSTEESVDRLYSAFTMMQKEFAFALQNIGYEDIEPEAINLIKEAVGSGRRVFVKQPVPPYEVGDLWTQGPGGDLLRCVLTRKDGDFIATDWQLATKYTNTPYAATVVVADEATSKNPANADFVVPAGSTDAQVTINAAIDSLSFTGGKVLLSEGVYIVDSSILLKSNVCLEGMGEGTLVKLADGAEPDAIIKNVDQLNGNSDITLSNFALEGTEKTTTKGVLLKLVKESIIQNLKVKKFITGETGSALYLEDSRNNIINSCIFENNAYAVLLRDSSGNSIIGISAINDNCFGIVAEGDDNTIGSNTIGNGTIGIIAEGNRNTVVGNTVYKNKGPGIFGNTDTIENVCDNQFVSNVLTENAWKYPEKEEAQLLIARTDRANIQNNLIRRGDISSGCGYGIKIRSGNDTLLVNNDLKNSGFVGSLLDQGTNTITNISEAGNRL